MHSLFDLIRTIPVYQIRTTIDPTMLFVQQITFDSRTVMPGSLFVAFQGRQADGHRYIHDTIKRGAVAVIGALSPTELAQQGIDIPADFAYVQVPDTRLALALCSAAFYGFP